MGEVLQFPGSPEPDRPLREALGQVDCWLQMAAQLADVKPSEVAASIGRWYERAGM